MKTPMRHAIVLALVALFLTLAGGAKAQISQEVRDYYQSWLATVQRAENVIETNRASNASLENLRTRIVEYREEFARVRDLNTSRIATLQSQLEALGPKPDSGEESEDIAKLRLSLTEDLNALRVPSVVSGEAHNQAKGLIREIDQVIRQRQAKLLLSRGPSPLNPMYWPVALEDFSEATIGLINETKQNWHKATRVALKQRLPVILVLSCLGLLLLLRGKVWSEWLGHYMRQFGGRGTGVWGFVVSLAQVILPFFGAVVLSQALIQTGALGVRGTLIAEAVPGWVLILLFFNWLADQLYGGTRKTALLPTPKGRRGEMMTYVRLLAVVLVLQSAVELYDQIEKISDASRAIIAFPVILGAALLLLRMQQVGLREIKADLAASQALQRSPGVYRIFRAIRRGAVLLAMLSPVLAGFGYGAAAEAIIYPVILTLVTASLVLILQRFIGDVYAWVWRSSGVLGDEGSLFSVLAGFFLLLLSLPVLALIWGARPAELAELWMKFMAGFQIGEARISPVGFLKFAIIFVAGYSATRLMQSGLRTNLLPKTQIDPGGQNAIVAFTGYLGIFLAALIAVSSAGLDLSSVAIVAGALSVGIGFGLQTIVSNFVSGIILLIERPIAKGDWIEVAGFAGYVRDISVRSTRIETFDRADVIVPNSDLISGSVINYTRGKTVGRVKVPVGVGYGTDTRLVEKILLEVANGHPMVLANPSPNVVFHGFGADALDFEIRAILRDVNWVLSVKSDMNHEIAKRFSEANIEIPFAQRDIWLRNPEVLTGGTATPPDYTLSEGAVDAKDGKPGDEENNV